MSDTPTPAPEPGATPSPLNQAQLASLTKTEEICRVALLPAYLAQLVTEPGEEAHEDDITEAKITAALADCNTVRNYSGEAVSATTEKVLLTQKEIDTQDQLEEIIHFIQARARLKHYAKNPGILKDYGIGENITVSRAVLEQYALAIYQKTATDKLSKVTGTKRQELFDALDAYKGSQTDQGTGQSTASQLRGSRDNLLKTTVAQRMKIQFAADAEWPHTTPDNHPIRMQFQLPANRAFVG